MPCYIEKLANGGTMFLCGKLGPHCAAERCSASSGFLCDYPVGKGKTCDLPLCASHAYEVAPEIHYCPGHLTLWNAFRDSGGVERELKNVMPFKARRASEHKVETVAGPVEGGVGSIRIVSERKGGTAAAAGELVIDVDRRHPALGNQHVLSNHKDEVERTLRIEEFEVDFRADMDKRGPMFTAVMEIADEVRSGRRVALRCWCAPRRCHAGIIAATVVEMTGCAGQTNAAEVPTQMRLL